MKTYPIELRQKIIDAVDQQLGTYKEIVEIFGITESYIYKLLKQRRETGSLAPLPRGG
jgi:transposase